MSDYFVCFGLLFFPLLLFIILFDFEFRFYIFELLKQKIPQWCDLSELGPNSRMSRLCDLII